MRKYTTLLVITFTLFIEQAGGQSFKKQFNSLMAKKDTAGEQNLLLNWAKIDSNDAELYVAYFNYYVSLGKQDVIELGDNPQGKEAIAITDTDPAKPTPVGYLYNNDYYNPVIVEKGISYINRGIEKNPTRLDMRFGKIYTYGKLEKYEDFTAEIIKTINYSALIKNKWTWTDNKPVSDPQKFMLSSIQEYIVQLYNTVNDSLLDNMKQIAETVLKYYPDNVECLSDLSIVYLLNKKYEKGLEVLLKAEKIAPKDYIVLNNIAQAYARKGDNNSAIKYYNLVIKYGTKEAKDAAKQQIDLLKKKQ